MKLTKLMKTFLLTAATTITVLSSPLTFELQKGKTECIYTLTTDIDCTINYYFAVQSGEGNDFDVGYEIFSPDDRKNPLFVRSKERQGEWHFVAQHKGEYKFCFHGGRLHNKVIDFEVTQQCARKDDARSKKLAARKRNRRIEGQAGDNSQDEFQSKEGAELDETLEGSLDAIEEKLMRLERGLQYYRSRNSRNHYTVKSAERRTVQFSIYVVLLIVGMGAAQIAVLQWIFKQSRRNNV